MNKKSILKSSLFLKLFTIPYITWFVISLIALIPDETEPITLGELLITNIVILLLWFGISFLISLIVNKIKNNNYKTKNVKEIQSMTKHSAKIIVNQEKKDTSKKEKKKKNNDKYLYSCESKIDSYEYKKMAKYFPQIYWTFVAWGTIINFILTTIVAILFRNTITTLIFLVLYQIYIMILYKVRLEHFVEKVFNSQKKKIITDTEFHIEFYDDCFIRQGNTETIKYNYNDIDRCIETNTNFYLGLSKRNKIIIIQKNSCSLELISFIRKKFNNLENHIGDNSNFKGVKKYHNPNFIKIFMIVLFIITICSLWGALYSVALANIINPQHGFNFIKNTWVFWCWLPIPILSIVLGFKYKKAGFKCTKNIVGGFIIGFLLLIYGSFWLIPTFEEDYSKLDKYKTFIDAKLPNNGELEIQDWGTYFDDDKTNYKIINIYYDKENVKDLVESIKNSENWILSKEIKSELKIFIPSTLRSDNDAYYSIYNATTKEYNAIPEKPDNYEIYAMKYDISNKQLEIHKFNYLYK